MRRRELLGVMTAASVGASPLGSTLATLPHGKIGRGDAMHIQQVAARLYRLDYQHGGESLWQTAIMEADRGSAMLEHGSYGEATGKLLLQATGRMRMCAGWLAFDAGRHDVARSCYTEALTLARQADDHEVETHALANLAFQSNALGHPREAIRFSEAAERSAASDGLPPRLSVVPQIRRAIACAISSDAQGTGSAIKQARTILDQVGDQPTVEWLTFVSPLEVDGIEATCATMLGQSNRAEQLLEHAISGHGDAFARNRALYNARLARARLDARAVDGAAEAASAALDDLDGEVASWRVATELDAVMERLSQHPQVPGIAVVLARYRTLGSRPATPHR